MRVCTSQTARPSALLSSSATICASAERHAELSMTWGVRAPQSRPWGRRVLGLPPRPALGAKRAGVQSGQVPRAILGSSDAKGAMGAVQARERRARTSRPTRQLPPLHRCALLRRARRRLRPPPPAAAAAAAAAAPAAARPPAAAAARSCASPPPRAAAAPAGAGLQTVARRTRAEHSSRLAGRCDVSSSSAALRGPGSGWVWG